VLRAWMARATIFALPARYEPFGLSALEAAQAGCALVLGDIPTLREVWGDDALFVAPGDVDALAHAIDALIADPLRAGAIGACARARSEAMSAHRMAQSYAELYAELVPDVLDRQPEEVYS
jgi:glycogen(starch) synthase